MSRPRIQFVPIAQEQVREQVLKMVCPGCKMAFYWIEHSPCCSVECREIEAAAQLLRHDDDEWYTPEAWTPSYNDPDGRNA